VWAFGVVVSTTIQILYVKVFDPMQSSTHTHPSWQQQVYDLLFNEQNPQGLHASVTRWSTLLILLNVLAMVLETADAF